MIDVFHDASAKDFSIPAADATWIATTEWALIAVEGPDAVKFLQGQVTCDVLELSAQVARRGAQCTAKGRMLFSFRAVQPAPERLLLRVHASLVETALQSLGKYIVFSKAKLMDGSSNYQPIVIHGPHAEAVIQKMSGTVPAAIDEWTAANGNIFIKTDDHSFECWLTSDQAEQKCAALIGDAVAAGANTAALLAIRQGLGEVCLSTKELFTPQALNFQLINAINFRKGCYTGQEIVARLHYRGTLKRHMYRVEFALSDNEDLPEPGSLVVSGENKNIGEIVMAARAGAGTAEALAVVADEYLLQAALPGPAGEKLSPLPLPYAIPTEES
jgi:folate-binding protein YgfZ